MVGGIIMTQEDKELLLKDLCARLPYGLKVKCEKYSFPVTILYGSNIDEVKFKETGGIENICTIKPYLFPFSSMTEGQKEELNKKFNVQFLGNTIYSIHYHSEGYWDDDLELDLQDWLWFINWCYKNHFDIYGLIPMGLAIDATGLNIY